MTAAPTEPPAPSPATPEPAIRFIVLSSCAATRILPSAAITALSPTNAFVVIFSVSTAAAPATLPPPAAPLAETLVICSEA